MPTESRTFAQKKPSVYIKTFGCQMNERDSEFVAGLFLENGYEITEFPEKSDVILFNTCSVREHAEERAIHAMGQIMYKYKNKIYGIIGCGAQALKEKLFKRLPRLDIVCGTGEIHKLPSIVKDAEKEKVLAINDIDELLPEENPPYRKNKDHSYVYIMRGCNNFCTYCIVPYVRGKERSRKIKDVIKEIQELSLNGVKDITLLGQNVNSYKDEKSNFVELLKKVNEIDGDFKVNFFTSHPKDVTSELFKAMSVLDKVVKHLHLPLQSGSDKILKLMARGYTGKKYKNLTTEARKTIPGLKLTTDIIVGFPGESDKDFMDTVKFMKDIRFDASYLFKYSPREGTKAAKMKDDVPIEIKKKRHKILLDLQRSISKEKR